MLTSPWSTISYKSVETTKAYQTVSSYDFEDDETDIASRFKETNTEEAKRKLIYKEIQQLANKNDICMYEIIDTLIHYSRRTNELD